MPFGVFFFRVCREHLECEGWTIAGAYKDSAIWDDSVILRPGTQALLEDSEPGKRVTRFNHGRRAAGASDRRELAAIEKPRVGGPHGRDHHPR